MIDALSSQDLHLVHLLLLLNHALGTLSIAQQVLNLVSLVLLKLGKLLLFRLHKNLLEYQLILRLALRRERTVGSRCLLRMGVANRLRRDGRGS